MSQLLAAAALVVTGLLPLPPIPGLPTADPATQPAADPVVLAGALDAPDGRLKKGCKDYSYSYAVTTESEDWTFDITMQDRAGKGVNSQSLLGPNDPESGVLTFRLCERATKPGTFTLTGALTAYEGYSDETTVPVTDTFTLRKTKSRKNR
ncbi:hypothetical protein SAMN04489844_3156 [Nocardioides exalbidus]|uniref:Uncharacterized protein n=1 Tax=Nocardioides exalbidus TaxID=402596 RepID=A0A1H4W1E2_9ACTN|nr:hypothetical protein [Nocardioides exalbidus]SEC87055.1 hypothetical protein SAMN04489844_3156 [Nocardioides exalbidus]